MTLRSHHRFHLPFCSGFTLLLSMRVTSPASNHNVNVDQAAPGLGGLTKYSDHLGRGADPAVRPDPGTHPRVPGTNVLPTTEADRHVARPEQNVTGLRLGVRHRVPYRRREAGAVIAINRHTLKAVHVLHESDAIPTGGRFTAPDVWNANKGLRLTDNRGSRTRAGLRLRRSCLCWLRCWCCF